MKPSSIVTFVPYLIIITFLNHVVKGRNPNCNIMELLYKKTQLQLEANNCYDENSVVRLIEISNHVSLLFIKNQDSFWGVQCLIYHEVAHATKLQVPWVLLSLLFHKYFNYVHTRCKMFFLEINKLVNHYHPINSCCKGSKSEL